MSDYADQGLPSANPNFVPASAEPYQAVFDRFVAGPDAQGQTPIQQAMRAQAPPGLSPEDRPPLGRGPAPGSLPPNLANPYAEAEQAEQAYDGDPQVAGLLERMQQMQTRIDQQDQFQQQLMQAAQQQQLEQGEGYEGEYGEYEQPAYYPPQMPDDPYDPQQMQEYYGQVWQSAQEQAQQYAQVAAQQYVEQMWNERMAPFAPILGQVAQQQAEAAASEVFEELQQEVGPFDADQAYALSIAYAQMGYEPEQALEMAARHRHEDEKQMFQRWSQGYQDTVNNVAGAPSEVHGPAQAASEIEPVPQGANRYSEASRRFFARRNGQAIPTA